MRTLFSACGVLSLFLSGCLGQHDCFQVELTPEGEAFQRQLTGWHTGDAGKIASLGYAQRTRIGRLYPKEGRTWDGSKLVFAGRFQGSTPGDVGGAGSYTHFASSLGSTSCYVERFRGDDDLASQLAKRREKADRLVDVLVGWFGAELGNEPNFPALKEFLNGDFRRDLRNLAVYSFVGEATADPKGEPEHTEVVWLMRTAQYFSERGYFSPGQVPSLTRDLLDGDGTTALRHVQRLVARKMRVPDDQPVPESLAFLGDFDRLEASLKKYARSSGLLQKRHEASELPTLELSRPKEITADNLVDELVGDAVDLVGFDISFGFFGADSLDVKLVCGVKPYATNGKWDETAGAVTWGPFSFCNESRPVVCLALWSAPDRAFQEKHFGKVLLGGSELAEYATWYRSLKADEAAEWDGFLGGLKPGAGLKPAVAGFRFRADPKPDPAKPDETPHSLAHIPRKLIVAAIDKEAGQQPAANEP